MSHHLGADADARRQRGLLHRELRLAAATPHRRVRALTGPPGPMRALRTAVGMLVVDLSEAGGPFLGSTTGLSSPASDIVTWHPTASTLHGEPVVELVRTSVVAARGRRG